MSTVKFIPKAERERIREEAERAKMESQKKIEEENKRRRREIIKQATKKKIDAESVGEDSGTPTLTSEELEMIRSRFYSNNQPDRKRINNGLSFDWSPEEDTGVGVQPPGMKIRRGADPLEKDDSTEFIHWTKKLVNEMSDRDWRIFREENRIAVKPGGIGGRIPVPFRSWIESPLPDDLKKAVSVARYIKPTPIQMQAIPIAMTGRDLIGIAETGSGKTAAFILPMLVYVKNQPRIDLTRAQDGPYALVLAPTRELAVQIETEAKKFGNFCQMRICSIVGGKSMEQQSLTLSQGVELIVATPGRLADSLDASHTVLNQCFYVVLDEADRMVNLGFESYLNKILDSIPATNLKPTEDALEGSEKIYRITQMFSATMPTEVERLTRKYLRFPTIITVGEPGQAKSDIEQRIEFVTEVEKRKKLREVINATEAPIIVFVNTKKTGDSVGRFLDTEGWRVIVLHSGKGQDKREEAIDQFRSKKVDVLVATDVAGRGIDIPGIQHVINYDLPETIEDYTHRIGRTGRAGRKGLATSFVTPFDEKILSNLKTFLIQSKQFIPEELEDHPATKMTKIRLE